MISDKVEPKQKKRIHESPSSFSSLPDELTESILARVSRWNYPSLSLVSKRFHSLLSSKEIYKTRSQVGAVETCVYVLLTLPDHPCMSWFSLRTKPNNKNQKERRRGKIRFKRDSSRFSVVPIPSSSSASYPELSRITTVGPEIYIMGGPYKEPSTSVRIFDCQSHTWRDGPNMTVPREDANTVLLDEKIYVMGGCNIDKYNANWIEVFDVKTQALTALPGLGAEEDELRNHLHHLSENSKFYHIAYVFKRKLYLESDAKQYKYEPKNGAWKLVRETSNSRSYFIEVSCEMGNVLYCCTDSGYLMWYASDIEGGEWRVMKGLEKLRELPTRGLHNATDYGLVGCGGQLLVMWDPYPFSPIKRSNKIWYAKISLESRRNGREIWGKVECVDVLTFPVESYEWFSCVAASV